MATGEKPPVQDRARRVAAAAFAAAFAVLLPVAVTSAWIRGTVLSTSGYVAAVTPVAANPVVQDTVQDVVTSQVDAAFKRAETSLPPAADVLTGPLSTGLADLARNLISEFMVSSAFQRLWADVNRFAHSQLISVLNGDSTLIHAAGGEIVLNVVPLINDVLHGIFGHLPALARRGVSLLSVSAIPAAACRVLPGTSSLACVQIPLFPAAALAGPRHAYRILIVATWLVLAVTLLAFAGALAASPRRRRTLFQMTVSSTFTLLAGGTALSWLRSSLIARAMPRYHALTSAIVHALTNGFFNLITWCIAGGLAVAAVALLSGPFSRVGVIRAALGIGR